MEASLFPFGNLPKHYKMFASSKNYSQYISVYSKRPIKKQKLYLYRTYVVLLCFTSSTAKSHHSLTCLTYQSLLKNNIFFQTDFENQYLKTQKNTHHPVTNKDPLRRFRAFSALVGKPKRKRCRCSGTPVRLKTSP